MDLFDADEVVASRTHAQYEFSSHGRVVARTRNRPVAASHWWKYVFRLLGSSSATRYTEMEVCDAAGLPRWQIALDPGDPNTYAADVALPDGTPVGRVSADGGLVRPFPRIHLTGPAGEPLGHATSKGAPQVFDTSDRLIADFTWLGARRPLRQAAVRPALRRARDLRGATGRDRDGDHRVGAAPMTTPGPEQPHVPRTKGIVSALGTGLGCLFLLLGAAVLAVVALAYFFDEPALGLAVIALVVALAAYKSRARRT